MPQRGPKAATVAESPEPDLTEHLAPAVRSIGHAADNVAAAVEKSGTNGLKGMLAQNVGNLTAVGFVCVLVLWQSRDAATNAREDRGMFREELKAQREEHRSATDKLGDKLDGVRGAVEANTRTVERVGRIGKTGGIPMGGMLTVPPDAIPRVMPGPANVYHVREAAPEPHRLVE